MPHPATRDEQLAFIRRALVATGWSQTVLAKRAGLDPSTLSRFLSNTRDDRALRMSTMLRIGEVSGLGNEFRAGQPESGDMAEEARQLEAAASSTVAAMVLELRHRYPSLVAWQLNSRALELAGLLPGDTLLLANNERPAAGDVVWVQHFDRRQQKVVTLFRLYHPPYLVAAATDPASHTPLPADGGDVTIMGVVVASCRLRRGT